MKKIICIIALVMIISGCATLHSSGNNQYERLSLIGEYLKDNSIFIGRILIAPDGNTFIELKDYNFGLICNGIATIVFPNGKIQGQNGELTLNCADGKIMNAEIVYISPGSGEGIGTDHKAEGSDPNANDLVFIYGVNEKDVMQYVEKKKAMGQIKDEEIKMDTRMIGRMRALIKAGVFNTQGIFDSPYDSPRKQNPYLPYLMALSGGMQAFGAGLTHQSYTYHYQPVYTTNTQMYNTSYPIQVYDNSFQRMGYVENGRIYNTGGQDVGYIQNNLMFNENSEQTGYIQNGQIYNNQMERTGQIQKNN